MADDCFSLGNLKKQYGNLRKRYSLPSFGDLNRDFEIEKLQERETETLTREIRRAMSEKSLSYLKFAEMFMNPSQAPMFFFALVKSLDSEDRRLLEELYIDLGKIEIKSIALDNDYDEGKDIDFIKIFYKKWQEIKKKFGKIMDGIEKSWEKKIDKRDKGYLG